MLRVLHSAKVITVQIDVTRRIVRESQKGVEFRVGSASMNQCSLHLPTADHGIGRRRNVCSQSEDIEILHVVTDNRRTQVVASVSVYLPEVRFTTQSRKQIVPAFREAGKEISRRLEPKQS